MIKDHHTYILKSISTVRASGLEKGLTASLTLRLALCTMFLLFKVYLKMQIGVFANKCYVRCLVKWQQSKVSILLSQLLLLVKFYSHVSEDLTTYIWLAFFYFNANNVMFCLFGCFLKFILIKK